MPCTCAGMAMPGQQADQATGATPATGAAIPSTPAPSAAAGAPTGSAFSLVPGEVYGGRYKAQELYGVSTAAEMWAAVDTTTGAQVMIKVRETWGGGGGAKAFIGAKVAVHLIGSHTIELS